MNKIIKVIYQDGSETEPKNISPLIVSEDKNERWRDHINYERQFIDFEKTILRHINQDTVESYAVNNFDLVDENELDAEKKDISDFDDDEIMEEVRGRKLLGDNNSIISEQFISRFSKIMEKENQILLDSVLTEFEIKLNIIPK